MKSFCKDILEVFKVIQKKSALLESSLDLLKVAKATLRY